MPKVRARAPLTRILLSRMTVLLRPDWQETWKTLSAIASPSVWEPSGWYHLAGAVNGACGPEERAGLPWRSFLHKLAAREREAVGADHDVAAAQNLRSWDRCARAFSPHRRGERA